MEDEFREQLERILQEKDREALEALYFGALNKGDWRQAHDLLLKLIVLLIETSGFKVVEIRVRQEVTNRQIKAIEKRLDTLTKTGGKHEK